MSLPGLGNKNQKVINANFEQINLFSKGKSPR